MFALHNIEEVFSFANGWSGQHLPGVGLRADDWEKFAAIAILLTCSIAAIAWLLRKRPEASLSVLKLFLCIMLLNAAWHVGVSIYTTSVAPGAISALLLILPIYGFFLLKLSRTGESHAA